MPENDPRALAVHTAQVAHIFKCAAHELRLRVLLALTPGECVTSRLQELLNDADPRQVAVHAQTLYEEGLAKRRTVGRQAAYSLSRAGTGVAHSYYAILRQLGYETTGPPLSVADAGPVAGAPNPPRHPSADESIHLMDAATLLNHGANALRLRLLFSLSEKDRSPTELCEELGGIKIGGVNRNLSILRDGDMIGSHRTGLQTTYSLTVNGLSLIQILRATCGSLTIRRGELILRPQPIMAGESGALDPTSPEGLACLLRAFADPIRIRVLHVLVAAGEVCSCHLPEILQVPRRLVLQSMLYPRKTGLILDRQERGWVYLRPAPPASDLCRSLMGCLGLRLYEAHALESDRQRLQNLHPCPDLAPSDPREYDAASPSQAPSSGQDAGAARTA